MPAKAHDSPLLLLKNWIWILLVYFISNYSLADIDHKEILKVAIVNPAIMDPADPGLYYEQVLILALEKTKNTDGDFVILHKPNTEGAGRARAMLISNSGIDVIWSSVTKERKDLMKVIPFNLLRGLNDYRVLLIQKNDQKKFNRVQSLSDLKKFTAGSGAHWNDTQVLRNNDIPVVTSTIYTSLFKMLAAHRFDFIACGLHEIDYAYGNFGNMGLAVEKNILLHYEIPTPYSFFVNKDNIKLADRIQRGLAVAEADGSFEQLFNSFPGFKQRLSDIKNNDRLKILLKNNIEQ